MRRRYKAYTAKKFKMPKRILFFSIIAVIIFIIAVIWGNALKAKVDREKIKNAETTEELVTDTEPIVNEIIEREHNEKNLSVMAGCFNFLNVSDEKSGKEEIDYIQSSGFNTVSVMLNNDEGYYNYASNALCAATHIAPSEKLLSFNAFRTVMQYAKGKSFRLSAILKISENKDLDCIVAEEISQIGFDEIIILGFEDLAPTNDSASEITMYIDRMRDKSNTDFSIVLSPEVFLNSKNAPFIEKIFAKTEFLSIDMRNADESVSQNLSEKISGSFKAYMLRPILDGVNQYVSEIRAPLLNADISACQYISSAKRIAEETTDAAEDD